MNCPNCGYCRHCGRGDGSFYAPRYPYEFYPKTPSYPQWTYTNGTLTSTDNSINGTIFNQENLDKYKAFIEASSKKKV